MSSAIPENAIVASRDTLANRFMPVRFCRAFRATTSLNPVEADLNCHFNPETSGGQSNILIADNSTPSDLANHFGATMLSPNSEIGIGSTGDPPVPSGHWPDGRDRTLALKTEARKIPGAFPVPSGGSPLGTGQWPVLPRDGRRCFGIRVKINLGIFGR